MRINDNIKTITMKIKLITLSVSCLLLSSCGIYTTYERPSDINTDGLYGQDLNEEAVAVDTASIASLSWRELFTDSHLQTICFQPNSVSRKPRLLFLRRSWLICPRLCSLPRAVSAVSTSRKAHGLIPVSLPSVGKSTFSVS